MRHALRRLLRRPAADLLSPAARLGAARTATMPRSRSTWRISRCAEAAPSMASAGCMAKSAASSFSRCFPRWPTDEVPVGHVTNGVHVPTWDSTDADELWTEVCGNRTAGTATLNQMETRIREATMPRIWSMRSDAQKALDRIRAKRAMRARSPTKAVRRGDRGRGRRSSISIR